MKKILFSLLVICISSLVLVLFFRQPKKNIPVITLEKKPSLTAKETQKETARIIISQVAPILPEQSSKEIFKEFNLSQALMAKLSKAQETGKAKTEWGKAKISAGELYQAGLMPGQVLHADFNTKERNITAGFSVPDSTFTENLNNTLSDKTIEDEQTRILNSNALSDIGFSALMENNYAHAEESFGALIRDYPDTQAAPVIYLELARLVAENGRVVEAEGLVDKAITQYGSDIEYLELAQSLKATMLTNE